MAPGGLPAAAAAMHADTARPGGPPTRDRSESISGIAFECSGFLRFFPIAGAGICAYGAPMCNRRSGVCDSQASCGRNRCCRADLEAMESYPAAAAADAVLSSSSSLSSPASATTQMDEPPRAKFLCSFGGRILPRPLDGKLRYVGGETRIVSVPRDVTHKELMARMWELFEGAWSLKYQQPEEDLDALVSVVNDDDVANMMEEHDKLVAGGDGFTRLRVFLFSNADLVNGADSASAADARFDSSDEWETERRYVDALNNLTDGKPQFSGDVQGGAPVDGSGFHRAGDQFFGHGGVGGIDAGLHGLFKLRQLNTTLRHSHGQRYNDMEGTWSPVYCSPGCCTPHDPQDFPPSPSSGQCHPGFAETNDRIPDAYVPHQSMQYEHLPLFADDAVWLPPGCVGGEKVGFPGSLGHTHDFHESDGACEHCRIAFQRNQALVSEDRIQGCWRHGQLPLEQLGSGFPVQLSNSSCGEGIRSREAYLLQHDIGLDHSFYTKGHSERHLFSDELQSNQQMNHSPEEPRMCHNEQFTADSNGMNFSFARGNLYERHSVIPNCITHDDPCYVRSADVLESDMYNDQQFMADSNGVNFPFVHGNLHERHSVTPNRMTDEDPCYVRSAAALGNELYNDQLLAGTRTNMQVSRLEDKRTPYVNGPAYSCYDIHHTAPASSSINSLSRNVQGACSIPSCEMPSLLMPTHGAVNMGYIRTTQDGSPRFSHDGLDAQTTIAWAVQSGNAFQKLFPVDGHLNHEYYYADASEPCLGNQDTLIPEAVTCQPGKGAYGAPSGAVNVAAPSPFLVDDKSFASLPPAYCPNPAAGADIATLVANEINLTGDEYETSDAKVVNGFVADKNSSGDKQVSDSDPKESLSPVRDDNSSKFCYSDACDPCEQQELSAECLSFLPDLIASVKKATLEDIEMVKSKAEANAVDNTSPDRSRKESSLHDSAPVAASSGVDVNSDTEHKTISKIEPTLAEAEALAKGLQMIKNDDLEEIRELGSGTYGSVYHGKWKGSDVAIKRIKASCFAGRPSERERLIADFWKEALILSSLHHPNIVSFYGIVRDGPDGSLATVTEFMVNGSLKQFLQKKDRTIDRRKRLIIAMDVAFGMEYLHGKNIVHFDLKCDNLLVNMKDPHRPVCKIGDLGLSKVKQKTLVSGGVRGTLPWMAPELLSGKSNMVTEKIDVYSFGIVMWELLTGEEPYSDIDCASMIGGIVKNTLRPQIPTWCDPEWKALMESCWSSDPADRPSFSEISQNLRKMAAAINVK